MKLPFHLAPSTWIVIEDPYGDRDALLVHSWTHAQRPRAAGRPMFTPPPILTVPRETHDDVREHFRTKLLPFLLAGEPCIVAGGPLRTRAVPGAATREELGLALVTTYGDMAPGLLVVFPDGDGGHAPSLRALAQERPDSVVLIEHGGWGEQHYQVFDAMADRHLYGMETHA